jgi:RNA-splicing ligase RtcB
MVEHRFGSLDILVHRDHNHYEVAGDGVIIRKGSVKLRPGETTVVPSNLDGDVVLVMATDAVDTVLQSMCHGTGRVMSRSDAKEVAESYSFTELRQRIYIPSAISDASIKTEAPFCYRDLDACLRLLDGFVVEERRFAPFAYLGQF